MPSLTAVQPSECLQVKGDGEAQGRSGGEWAPEEEGQQERKASSIGARYLEGRLLRELAAERGRGMEGGGRERGEEEEEEEEEDDDG